MIINYLQSSVQPPVLPSLHKLGLRVFQNDTNVFELPFMNKIPEFKSQNQLSLGK